MEKDTSKGFKLKETLRSDSPTRRRGSPSEQARQTAKMAEEAMRLREERGEQSDSKRIKDITQLLEAQKERNSPDIFSTKDNLELKNNTWGDYTQLSFKVDEAFTAINRYTPNINWGDPFNQQFVEEKHQTIKNNWNQLKKLFEQDFTNADESITLKHFEDMKKFYLGTIKEQLSLIEQASLSQEAEKNKEADKVLDNIKYGTLDKLCEALRSLKNSKYSQYKDNPDMKSHMQDLMKDIQKVKKYKRNGLQSKKDARASINRLINATQEMSTGSLNIEQFLDEVKQIKQNNSRPL